MNTVLFSNKVGDDLARTAPALGVNNGRIKLFPKVYLQDALCTVLYSPLVPVWAKCIGGRHPEVVVRPE